MSKISQLYNRTTVSANGSAPLEETRRTLSLAETDMDEYANTYNISNMSIG